MKTALIMLFLLFFADTGDEQQTPRSMNDLQKE